MNTYSPEQQIHSLSLITNAAFGLEFPNYAALESYTNQVIATTLTDDQEVQPQNNNNIGLNYLGSTAAGTAWQLVWGPIVFCNDQTASPIAADNTMALYYNASQSQFVVGIAGTNSVSMYGWKVEDFEVGNTVAWTTINPKSPAPSNALIAQGSSIGINNLLSLTDPNNGNRTMIQQLQYFLVNSVKGNSNFPYPAVAVAGHSLGGALTPLMALYLYETMSTWNTGTYKVKTITAYPTAGPTAGNLNFANYVQGLPAASFVYVSKYNTLDVVPQAWQLDSMVTIPTLYNGNSDVYATTPPECIIGSLTLGAIASSINPGTLLFNKYTQITPHISMTGTYLPVSQVVANGSPEEQELYKGANNIETIIAEINTYLILAKKPNDNIGQYGYFLQNFIFFLLEAAYQHTTAYNATTMLNIQGLATEFLYVKNSIPGPSDAGLEMHHLVVKEMIATHPMLKGLRAIAKVNAKAGALAEA